jgi:hypothetical protein
MKHGELIFWLVGLVVVGCWLGLGLFSPGAKLRRRRRKSHSRVVSKTTRPSVRFSVRPPKE